jgi:hypothetical protein
MKETQKNMTYQTPKVCVVTFKVERGFDVSNLRSESLVPSNTDQGLEDLEQSSNSLTSYFNY